MLILKNFSADYANALTALSATGTFILALLTLWYLRREYRAKYRPYVLPIVQAVKMSKGIGYHINIIPQNIISHPCEVRWREIELRIGDEVYKTPDSNNWILIAQQNVGIALPVGHVNDSGVQKIREARYKNNRIELSFILEARSIDNDFTKVKKYMFEINVLQDEPQVTTRPEWAIDL